MAVAQPDIAEVKTIQLLDGCSTSQQLIKLRSYKRYLNTGMVHTYLPRYVMRDAHLEFLRAGATVIRTNTFGATIPILEKTLNSVNPGEYRSVIRQSVSAAREAIDMYVREKKVKKENYWILGTCGSATRCKYLSVENLNRQQCKDFHEERIKTFSEYRVFRLAFESIETEAEALVILELLEQFKNVRAYMSFRCDETGCLSDGKEVAQVSRKCYSESPRGQIFAVGVNCVSPAHIKSILLKIKDADPNTPIPLVACPRKSADIDERISSWLPMLHAGLAPANEWKRMNIRYIGGCCDTLAKHIANIRDEIDGRNSQLPER